MERREDWGAKVIFIGSLYIPRKMNIEPKLCLIEIYLDFTESVTSNSDIPRPPPFPPQKRSLAHLQILCHETSPTRPSRVSLRSELELRSSRFRLG